MTQKIFVNFPVADVAKSTKLYVAFGATLDPMFSNEHVSSLALSDAITIMLLSHEHMAMFSSKKIADATETVEALHCLSAESREAVDEALARALAAGGREDTAAKQDQGFMYGRRFEDFDGHSIDVMWLDVEGMKSAMAAQSPA